MSSKAYMEARAEVMRAAVWSAAWSLVYAVVDALAWKAARESDAWEALRVRVRMDQKRAWKRERQATWTAAIADARGKA